MFSKMRILLLAACLTSAASATALQVRPLIVGGGNAERGEFPFMASLQANFGHFCGGMLIKKDWVLTAAHCVAGSRVSRVYIGLHDQNDRRDAEQFAAARIVRHPQYNARTTDYDFALIKLSGESRVQPVNLNRDEITNEVMFTTIGWGETNQIMSRASATILQKVDVPFVSAETCRASYGANAVTDRMICAGYPQGGKDACFGDSGGPMFVYEQDGTPTAVGVVSWGQGCAAPRYYGVYSKINSVIDWIDQHTN